MANDVPLPDVPVPARPIHPFHAALLAGTVPLFLGGLLSDIGYARTAEPQWSNFASWLVAGAMVFTGLALLWSLVTLLRLRRRHGWPVICGLLLLVAFVLGLIDAFVHARDAWGIMPTGPILTGIVTVLAIIATWIGYSSLREGEAA